jgi:hypothetical protein
MGQYFTPVLLDSQDRITRAVEPGDYGSADKLAGHTRADTPFMTAVETLLALDGGARLVWAGDEHDPPPGQSSLYFLVEPRHFVRFAGLVVDGESGIAPNAERPAIITALSRFPRTPALTGAANHLDRTENNTMTTSHALATDPWASTDHDPTSQLQAPIVHRPRTAPACHWPWPAPTSTPQSTPATTTTACNTRSRPATTPPKCSASAPPRRPNCNTPATTSPTPKRSSPNTPTPTPSNQLTTAGPSSPPRAGPRHFPPKGNNAHVRDRLRTGLGLHCRRRPPLPTAVPARKPLVRQRPTHRCHRQAQPPRQGPHRRDQPTRTSKQHSPTGRTGPASPKPP